MTRFGWQLFTPLVLAALLVFFGAAAVHARLDWNLPAPLLPLEAGHEVLQTRRQLLMVVVDGLRADEARRLPHLRALAATGATAELTLDEPTFSSPQYAALLTGVPPVDSGVRNNQALHRLALDSLPAGFRRQGRVTYVVSDDVDWWQILFGDDWASGRVVSPPALVADALSHGAADLLLVHPCQVDEAGHAFGAHSTQYHDAAQAVDETVDALVKGWGGPGRVIAVGADHGHVDRGGHGGAEPEVRHTYWVFAGEGVRKGGAENGSELDIAPTLAALTGAPVPGTAEGRTLTGLLDLSREDAARVTQADAARRAQVDPLAEAGRARARLEERKGELWRGAALLPLLALAAWAVQKGGVLARRGAAAGLCSLFAAWAGHLLLFGPVSASAARLIGLVIQNVGLLSFGAAAAALFILGRGVLAGGVGDAARLSAGFALGASPAAVAMLLMAGAFTPRFTASPAWSVVAPMAAYAAYAAALLVALVPVPAAALRTLRARAPPEAS